ncbi:flagellar hook-associated protein FlgK [Cohaesibacter celericrescens]|uniref:Flagellar hook-associated protein 1 n=1 Tax=Cohaesibacter celericrescens TaxID=2067669 RepID=A0A2N5XWU4_9HYPH|nr:flagellar hook-associated protein FlgK [Cohaesibacter celericrescens]PLW75520.1 flagellar hook-associated protein FlgK [Cohaesibacter celericrescens]PLW78927.1 flagellar hook-associated protein FlgK [Cohaesibacter celericrescens]
MSLSVALQVAQSALTTRQRETAILSKNITSATEEGYSRKTALISSLRSEDGQSGGVYVSAIDRATDSALFSNLISSTSAGMTSEIFLDGVTRLSQTIGDPQESRSPSATLGRFANALQQYSAEPQNTVLAGAVLTGAQDLVNTLNTATSAVQTERERADALIADSVNSINSLLSNLEDVNKEVIRGTQAGTDITDALDERDQIVLQLSEFMGIRTETRANNDLVVTTDSGVMLFETTPRSVNFEATNSYVAGTTGNALIVDGVRVSGPGANMELKEGKIVGLMQIRDEVTVTYQNQLDEIARGLITAFSESDQVGTNPDRTGLFTYSGSPTVPASGTLVTGLAGSISIAASVDPDQGGDINRLRDGGISEPFDSDYVYNTGGEAGYVTRLQDLITNVDTPMTFDPATQVDTSNSLTAFASSSASWLEGERKQATTINEQHTVVVTRTAESLSNITGVNIDDEMQSMLEIERSYAATAKLITTINQMLDQLLQIAG